MLLLSDGSVTRHLQLITGHPITVECIEMKKMETASEISHLPHATSLLQGPLLRRQVLLHLSPSPGSSAPSSTTRRTSSSHTASKFDNDSKAVVYAASWWNADTVDKYLQDKESPIWVSLSKERTELYREILQVYYGTSDYFVEYVAKKSAIRIHQT